MNNSIVVDFAKLESMVWSTTLETIMIAIRDVALLMPLHMKTGANKRSEVRIARAI
jgi:hypothetical protein